MVEIYNHSNTNYTSNGDITLIASTVKGKVELNGVCEITIEHFYDNEGRWKYIIEDNVISCPTPWSDKQLFRIYNKVKTITGVVAYARHIFFDLADTTLIDVRPTDKDGQQALDIILENTPFTGNSNIDTISTAYYIRKNIVEALASDDENSFVKRWGGERYLDNYNLTINTSIGEDRGVRVEFGYNLAEIEEDVSLDEVVTRIIPTGYDGIILDGSKPWVDSPNINKYANIKQKVINFSDVKVKENVEDEEGFETLALAQAELIARCNLLFEGGIDTPLINYNVDMINLADTTAYKNYQMLEYVGLGDTVTCKHGDLDIDIKARCISYEWEVVGEKTKYTNIELGNFKENYFDKQSDITRRVDNIMNTDGTVKANEITGFIDSAKARLRAQKAIGQVQDVRAFIWEDLDKASPTYGCMIGGSAGIQISQQKTPDGLDWDFTSAFTAEGLIADKIVGNIFSSKNGLTWIKMKDGTFNLADKITYDGIELNFAPDVVLSWNQVTDQPFIPNGSKIDDLGNYTGAIDYTTQVNGKPTIITADDVKNTIITKDWIATLGLLVGKEIKMGAGAVIDWNSVSPPTAGQVGAKPSSYVPAYSEISGTKPPTNADNTASVVGSKLTKITSTGIYTGEVKASQIAAHTISIEHLTSATKDPIIKLFGGCSIDATASMEQGIGSAVRLKWDANNYIYISTNNITLYQSGSGQYVFNTAGFYLYNRNIVIDSGFLIIGGKINRGWGFSSGNKYWFGISADDTYVRMYNDDVTVADGVSYLGSPSGRFIKLYSTQAVDVSSDFRKKDNIMPYDTQLEMFYDLLRPISYTLKQGHSGRRHLGFIAQEVEEAMNEVGMEYKDLSFLQKAPIDINGNEIDPTTIENYETDERIADYDYSLAYTELIALNTHMIQKLREENQQLKNEIIEIKKVLGL